MLYLFELIAFSTFVLCLYCLVDIITTDAITTDASRCRSLPRLGWLLVVLFVPLVGSILWLATGRPSNLQLDRRSGGHRRPRSGPSEHDRPARSVAPDPRADAEFLCQCRRRAEEQRRKACGEG